MLALEAQIAASGTPFGLELALSLADPTIPSIVNSRLNLGGWLRALDQEDRAEAKAAAALYVALSRGFEILPRGTKVAPTWTRNYESCTEAADDVRAELNRLRERDHLMTWSAVRMLYPEYAHMERPDHVLALGAVTKSRPEELGGDTVRVIVDASTGGEMSLNEQMDELGHIPPTHLSCVAQAKRSMQKGGLQAKADMRDAFLQSKTAVDSIRLVGIFFEGVMYAYTSVGFGLANAPSHQQTLSCAISRIVMRRWTAAGLAVGPMPSLDHSQEWPTPEDGLCHLMSYLDDWRMSFPPVPGDPDECQRQADLGYSLFRQVCLELGVELQDAAKKTAPPCRTTDFLGVIFCLATMTLSLSVERLAKMTADLAEIQDGTHITVGELRRIVGVLQFATVVFAPCRAYLRQFIKLLKTAGPRPANSRTLPITDAMRGDVRTWLFMFNVLNGKPVVSTPVARRTLKVELYTDASFVSGAYFFGGRWCTWKWPEHWRTHRIGFSADNDIWICQLEAIAVLVALRDLAGIMSGPDGRGARVIMHIDNDPVCHMLGSMTSRSEACLPVIKECTWIMAAHGIACAPQWIASGDNECADILTRGDEVGADAVVDCVRRWSREHRDATKWVPQPALRPDLLACIDRAEFDLGPPRSN